MVLKPEAVRERLLRLEDVISRLDELGRLDVSQLRASFRDTWAVERGLQLASEIVFDVGNHILSAHFGKSAHDYEDIVAQLGALGVISDDADRDERARGLSKHPRPRVSAR